MSKGRPNGRLRIGTRGSALALAQARTVADALGPGAELIAIKTTGDRGGAPGDKSRFVKEIEDALLAGEVDVAVHSAKDVPGALPAGLEIAAVPAAEDPRDALIGAESLEALREGASVGTSSLRRRSQLLAARPDLAVDELRGNVDTRLGKLAAGGYEAIVLAFAGLRRLGRANEAEAALLEPRRFVPAPGQGMLALEIRAGDTRVAEALAPLDDAPSHTRLRCERAIVAKLDASCRTPVGACSEIVGPATGGALRAFAYAGLPDGSEWITDSVEGEARGPGRPRRAPGGADARRRRGRAPAPGRQRVGSASVSEGGIVHLVGAGPGDPGLATVRALELIERADAIVHDRLVSRRLLEGARPEAELIDVGKRPGDPGIGQEAINERLVELARSGKRVVRLKGGDPFVFGRGGEEAEALERAGVAFAIVPGVTAGVGAAAYAGIPVTHREEASAVAFVTAHEDPAKPESALDWEAIAAFPGTLVFYMGVKRLAAVMTSLVDHGRSPDEPAAVIERGTLPGQRVVRGTVGEIARLASESDVSPPALTIVGPVAALRERLAWLERAPLFGRRVVITRARAQASGLAATLAGLGAEVVEAPAIRIVPRLGEPAVERAVAGLSAGDFDLLCLTSPNGAHLLMEALASAGHDARSLAGTAIAAIGPGTAAALASHGLRADVVPERSIAEALAAVLTTRGVGGKRVLIARAAEARDVLPDELAEAGANVEVVALYETVREDLDAVARAAIGDADYVTFTSSSTVRNFVDSLGGRDSLPGGIRVVSIGPVTSATATELGVRVDVEAERHDLDGLVSALLDDAASHPRR